MQTVPTITNISALKKYPYEIALFILSSVVVYIFTLYQGLNDYIKKDSLEQHIRMENVIQSNTNAINGFMENLKSTHPLLK